MWLIRKNLIQTNEHFSDIVPVELYNKYFYITSSEKTFKKTSSSINYRL